MAEKIKREKYDAARTARGKWRDRVEKKLPDGTVKVIEDTAWNSNLIVRPFPNLLAALLANEPSLLGGILFSAQGEGDGSWDIRLPPPTFEATHLFKEYFRKPPDAIGYRTPEGEPSTSITNIILIRTTLDFAEANGDDNLGRFIREQGLFGGTATTEKDSGLQVNWITHKARFKDETLRLTRFIEITL